MTPEKLAGMGSILHEDGVAFRVWAPNAMKVYVTGSFNDWKEDTDELFSEENGFWYGDIKKHKLATNTNT
jgi:1,4-alpha-glucan branching enzyme